MPGLSSGEMLTLLIAGTLLGDAPDTDILFHFITKRTLKPSSLSDHRKYLTHAPLLWIVAGLGIVGISFFFSLGIFWQLLGLLVWLGPWSHFLCDSVEVGVMWLWPFSKRQFALYNSQESLDAHHVQPPRTWQALFREYFKEPVAYLELIISLIAVCVATAYYL